MYVNDFCCSIFKIFYVVSAKLLLILALKSDLVFFRGSIYRESVQSNSCGSRNARGVRAQHPGPVTDGHMALEVLLAASLNVGSKDTDLGCSCTHHPFVQLSSSDQCFILAPGGNN